MHIKKGVSWNKNIKKWVGTVDTGGQLSEKDENAHFLVATKVLVFMVVNINGHFKAPVAYYLINSLNGHEKSILLRDLLMKLDEKGIDVIGTTFDGDSTHRTACELLGANFNFDDNNKFKPYIDHPATGKPVHIFFDPCHSLKLVRNYFGSKNKHLIYNKKEIIDWKYIKKLHENQDNDDFALCLQNSETACSI